ncbi:putative flippase GtrA [Salibacterium salarium]|nr:putative flippase GtrA [Salibacterium salarium]
MGVINTTHYYISYLILHEMLEIHYMTAHVIGFLLSLFLSFFLNVYITFRVKPTLAKFLQFPLTQVFNITVSSIFVYILVEHFHIDSTVAPILSVFITVPLTFIVTGKILTK